MSYMATPKVSYTLRIPQDLKRLLESRADADEVSLTSLVVSACWRYLDEGEPKGRLTAYEGSVSTKPDIAALRAICNVPRDGFESVKNIDFPPKHEIVNPGVIQCSYHEWSTEMGEEMQCGLPEHSMKQKHGNWRRLG